MKRQCPLCGNRYEDFLGHLVLKHGIEDDLQFVRELERIEQEQKERTQFAEYVRQLREKKVKGLINAEEYRIAVSEWSKER